MKLLTPDELAERWAVKKSQIYRLSREGRIPVIEIGRYFRYSLPAIERWESEQAGSHAGSQNPRISVSPIENT